MKLSEINQLRGFIRESLNESYQPINVAIQFAKFLDSSHDWVRKNEKNHGVYVSEGGYFKNSTWKHTAANISISTSSTYGDNSEEVSFGSLGITFDGNNLNDFKTWLEHLPELVNAKKQSLKSTVKHKKHKQNTVANMTGDGSFRGELSLTWGDDSDSISPEPGDAIYNGMMDLGLSEEDLDEDPDLEREAFYEGLTSWLKEAIDAMKAEGITHVNWDGRVLSFDELLDEFS